MCRRAHRLSSLQMECLFRARPARAGNRSRSTVPTSISALSAVCGIEPQATFHSSTDTRMPLIEFGEWAPDVIDLDTGESPTILNVMPQADGYGPFKSLQGFTQPLPGACR